MTTAHLLLKGFVALLFGGVFAWTVFDRDSDDGYSSRQKYLPYISGLLLPLYFVTIVVLVLVMYGTEAAVKLTLSHCVGVFLHICLYYLVLMPALPFLRKHISARACAVLWMLPNYLYMTQLNYMKLPEPRWVVEVPHGMLQIALAVWFAGFTAVLGWKVISHIIFRFSLLRGASPVADPAVLEVWQKELEDARFRKPKFKLVTSPKVKTPLSVGLFKRTVRVVLPEREYTPEELSLVLRHELVHIGREDAWNKFFLVFCTAMCWFNPLMWTAMKKSAEDLELSCDETVLLDSGDGTRRQYAELLLKTAGDERGFTTCLSASAEALRYRLKSVVDPKKKRSGALVVGLVFFILCMSCGYVALAYGVQTGAELIYGSQPPEEYSLRSVKWDNDPFEATLVCTDEAALHQYLSSLRMEQITGNYFFPQEEKPLVLIFQTPKGALVITMSDEFIKLVPLYGKANVEYYYLPDGVDWDILSECIVECPALIVYIEAENKFEPERDIQATLWRVSRGEEILREMDPRNTPSGFYYNYPVVEAELVFNLPLNGGCEVEIIPKVGGESQTLTLDTESMTIDLPEEPSLYIVRGEFQGRDGKLYQAELRFEIGDI